MKLEKCDQDVKLRCPFQDCKKATKTFSGKKSLAHHVKTNHLALQELKCCYCNKAFTSLFTFRRHVRNIHSLKQKEDTSKIVTCPHPGCKEKCNGFDGYVKHWKECHQLKGFMDKKTMQLHSGPISYKCHLCEKLFNRPSYFENHLKLHEDDEAFKCDICDAKLNCETGLKSHYRRVHEEKRFKCENCDEAFTCKSDLENHHQQEKKHFQCPICDKDLKSQQRLDSHVIKVHEKPDPVSLSNCYKCPAKVQDLHLHMLRVHTKQKKAAKRVKCDLCQKEMTKPHLKIHQFVVHQGLKLNSKQDCPICGKTFASKPGLKIHIDRIHNNEKRFKCTECVRSFFSKAEMEFHRNTMHYDLKFECDICGQKVKSKNYLRVHKQTVHEGDKSKCDLCSKEFSSYSNFRRHMNTVHDQQQSYGCDLCNKKFSQSNNLIRHKKHVHDL